MMLSVSGDKYKCRSGQLRGSLRGESGDSTRQVWRGLM